MMRSGSWLPVFWVAVACNVTAAALAVLWLKPRVTRLMREERDERLSAIPVAAITTQGSAAKAAGSE
jgi:hypothetical protein